MSAEAPTTDKSEWLTPGQAANRLGVTPPTIRKWVDEGKLEGQKTALGRLVSLPSVEKLAKERSNGG